MNRRITFNVSDHEHAASRLLAARSDCSIAELSRRALLAWIAQPPPYTAALLAHGTNTAPPAAHAPAPRPVPASAPLVPTSSPLPMPVAPSRPDRSVEAGTKETAKSRAVAQYFCVSDGNTSAVGDAGFESIPAVI